MNLTLTINSEKNLKMDVQKIEFKSCKRAKTILKV